MNDQKIYYEVESLRFKYYDTQQKKIRISIPDIYVAAENKIIEIKSTWTYDEINMNDKIKAYKELNYNVKLIIGKNKIFDKYAIVIDY